MKSSLFISGNVYLENPVLKPFLSGVFSLVLRLNSKAHASSRRRSRYRHEFPNPYLGSSGYISSLFVDFRMAGCNNQRLSSLHKIAFLELSMNLVSLETKKKKNLTVTLS